MIDHSGFYRVQNGRAYRQADSPYRRRHPQRTAQGYTLVVIIAAVVTALAYLVRELILVWPA